MNLVEDSDMGDVNEHYDATQRSGDVSFNGTFDMSNGAHTGLLAKLDAGTEVVMTWVYSGTKGSGSAIGTTGTFVMSKITQKTTKKEMVTFSITGKFNTVLTESSTL
jgi:hypothetical protein